MKTNCQTCGDRFSPRELREFLEIASYADPSFVCDCCADSMNGADYNDNDFSDADCGL